MEAEIGNNSKPRKEGVKWRAKIGRVGLKRFHKNGQNDQCADGMEGMIAKFFLWDANRMCKPHEADTREGSHRGLRRRGRHYR